jgi:hypothetical protein
MWPFICLLVHQMAPDGVSAILNHSVTTLPQLRELAPSVTEWLREVLSIAHNAPPQLKRRLKALLGCEYYVTNLEHLGLWGSLIQHCSDQSLELGKPMQAYLDEHRLGEVLGEAYHDRFGKFELSSEVRPRMNVFPCGIETCVRRQDGILPIPFPRNFRKSQLWNEKCFIHCLRLIAIGIDDQFQTAVEGIVEDHKGTFKKSAIKGFDRMKNKCVSKEDHYHDEYPR